MQQTHWTFTLGANLWGVLLVRKEFSLNSVTGIY